MLNYVVFLCFLGLNAAYSVDSFPKCSIKDQDCLKKLYPTIVQEIAATGDEKLGIPVLEPLVVENLNISFLGVLEFILVKGTVAGISGCTFDEFTVDIEKGGGHQENTCSFEVEGQYKIIPNVILKTILGEDGIGGEGNLKLIIDQAHLSFDYPVHVENRDDGETYMKVDYKNIKYEHKIKGTKLFLENLFLGGVNTSNTAAALFNDNWEFFLRIFGKPAVDKGVGIYFDIVSKFFENIPTKEYISEDLSSFAKS